MYLEKGVNIKEIKSVSMNDYQSLREADLLYAAHTQTTAWEDIHQIHGIDADDIQDAVCLRCSGFHHSLFFLRDDLQKKKKDK